MFFSTAGFAFASSVTKSSQKPFSANTVITKDNADEILMYFGIDPTKIDKTMDVSLLPQATVGDLEKALKEAKKMPKAVVIYDDGIASEPKTAKNNGVSTSAVIINTGTATAYTNTAITASLTVNYAATGQYYEAISTYDQTKYWTGWHNV